MEKGTFQVINGSGETFSFEYPYYITNVDGLNSPTLSLETADGVGLDGSRYIGSTLNPNVLTINGVINFKTENYDMEVLKRNLMSIFSPKKGQGELRYYYEEGNYKKTPFFVTAPCFDERPGAKSKNYQKFSIELNCLDPYWYKESITENMAFVLGGLRLPMQLPVQFEGRITKLDITNDGDSSTPVRIKFYGPATLPEIRNNTTNKKIQLENPLASNEILEIYTGDEIEVTITDMTSGESTEAFQYVSIDSDFFELEIGNNNIEFLTGDSTEDAKVDISYNKRYLTV